MYYFSFQGRMPRLDFLMASLLASVLDMIAASLAAGAMPFMMSLGFIVGVIGTWIGLASACKRFHDLNFSGWFTLILFIPVVHFIVWILLLVIRGTIGPNTYGYDKLNPTL